MIRIRNMTRADIVQVSKIEEETFSSPWSADSFVDSLGRKDAIYIVACEDECIVGYCGLYNIVNEGNINNVAVSKLFRGQQIGFLMLTRLIELGNAQNIEAYTLEVRRSNEAAIKLYEKLKFIKEGIRKNFYNNPNEDAIIMWYRLNKVV
ncbi:MAG: ribosomal protein S18-alanine N-acetyltransferase [Lachnotalea sp.]